MRISDWSSDVCSSDLALPVPVTISVWPSEPPSTTLAVWPALTEKVADEMVSAMVLVPVVLTVIWVSDDSDSPRLVRKLEIIAPWPGSTFELVLESKSPPGTVAIFHPPGIRSILRHAKNYAGCLPENASYTRARKSTR